MAISYEYDSFADAAPADTNLATLLTLGAGEELVQAQVMCCNISGADLTIRVGIGTGASQDTWLCYDFTLYANLFVRFYLPGLGSLNKIFVRTSSADDVNFTVMGCKKTTV
jgi:hypothetical protein